MVGGRHALLSIAKSRDNVSQMLVRMQAIDGAGSTAVAAAAPGTGTRALLSLHLAVDSAKEHVDVLAKIHLGQMLTASGSISACAAHVHIKKWLLEDGPALAHVVFKPILEGAKEPLKLGVPWLDDLVAELYRAVVTEYGGRPRVLKQKRANGAPPAPRERIKRQILVPAETPLNPELLPALRRSSRLLPVPAPAQPSVPTPLPVEQDSDDSLTEPDDDLMQDEISDGDDRSLTDELARDGDDSLNDPDFIFHGPRPSTSRRTDVFLKKATIPLPRAGSAQPQSESEKPEVVAIPRNRVELSIPKLKPDGRPSAMAPLQRKKHTIKTHHFWVEFDAFESGGAQRRYQALTVSLVETLFELLIAPGLRRANLHHDLTYDTEKSTKCNGTATQRLIALIVARGWMLEVFRSAAGTDVVWMAPSLAKLWRRPHHSFAKWKVNVWRMVQPLRMSYRRALERDESVQLPEDLVRFQTDVRAWFAQNREATAHILEFDRHFHYHVDELRSGHLERRDANQPQLYRQAESRSSALHGADKSHHTPGGTGKRRLRVGALPSDLTLPKPDAIAMPAMMLSMAFERDSRQRVPSATAALAGQSVAVPLRDEDKEAELLFTGRDPSNLAASNRYTSDMVNPVRVFWSTYKILATHIPADRIREPKYLKNLVMAIATGQSMLTADFLLPWMQVMPETADRMRELYEEQKHVNDMATSEARTSDGIATASFLARHSNFVPMEDMRVYGTTCNEFSWSDGDAIAPIFGDTITQWLSGFLERNPEPAEQVSWEEMGTEISSWGIKPFIGDGLAKLHLRHHLADRGLCRPASVFEVARWISQNRTLGAFKALAELGFQPLDSENDVVHALQIEHNQLSGCLDDDHKKRCHFDAAMVENYLCKIHRMRNEMSRLGIDGVKWSAEYFSIPRTVDVRAWDTDALIAACQVYG